MNNKVLVTGGAGYIGCLLVNELLNQGYDVTVIDNFMYQQTSLLNFCNNKNFKVVKADVRDMAAMEPLVQSHHTIFPLAAIVGAPACSKDPTLVREVHIESITNLMKLISNNHRVVYPVTNSGYGIGNEGEMCTEDSPLRPISLYGSSKVEAEKIIKNGCESITLRLATVFGMSPRMRLDLLVNEFVYKALYDRSIVLFESHFKRNFIHVRDVVNTFLWSLENFEDNKNETFNVGLSSANLSKMELCLVIKKYLPHFEIFEAKIGQDPDKRNYVVSNQKIESKGWRPRYTLEDGIEELIKGYAMIRNGGGFDNIR